MTEVESSQLTAANSRAPGCNTCQTAASMPIQRVQRVASLLDLSATKAIDTQIQQIGSLVPLLHSGVALPELPVPAEVQDRVDQLVAHARAPIANFTANDWALAGNNTVADPPDPAAYPLTLQGLADLAADIADHVYDLDAYFEQQNPD